MAKPCEEFAVKMNAFKDRHITSVVPSGAVAYATFLSYAEWLREDDLEHWKLNWSIVDRWLPVLGAQKHLPENELADAIAADIRNTSLPAPTDPTFIW
jgi:hypothetical protein